MMEKRLSFMQYIIVFCVFAVSNPAFTVDQNSLADLVIRISPVLLPTGECLSVEEELKGSDKEYSFVRFPENTTARITVLGKAVKYQKTSDPFLLKIFHQPNAIISIKYMYCSKNTSRDLGQPIIESMLSYLPLGKILAIPEQDMDKKKQVLFEFSRFPSQFSLISSFNVSERKFKIKESINAIRSSVVVIGDLAINNLLIQNMPVYLVEENKGKLNDTNLGELIETLCKKHRNFWSDDDFEHYVLLRLNQTDPRAKRTFRGLHFNNFISTIYSGEENTYHHFVYSISHELSHAWVSYKIKRPTELNSLTWFFEGFNDYIGMSVVFNSSLMTVKEFLDISNLKIKDYNLSPVKKSRPEDNMKYYQRGGEYTQISQIRGHFFAKELHSKYPKAFDNAMRALLSLYQNGKEDPLTIVDIDKVFNEHFGEDVWSDMRRRIYSGAEIYFPADMFSFAKQEMQSVDAPEFGFDTLALLQENVIRGVDKESNAYKAGLRDGQHVEEYRVYFGFADRVATIDIVENGKTREIVFKPNVVKKVIPQYVGV